MGPTAFQRPVDVAHLGLHTVSVDTRLPHGYTNATRRLGRHRVEKRYEGPARWDKARREAACLGRLAGRLPVPVLVSSDPSVPALVMTAFGGRHGQELIDEGHGRRVLRLVGRALADLQALGSDVVPELPGTGPVIVHGDFGPQNTHLDLSTGSVVAIYDWESAHLGQPVEDLAWTEWIIRMHHPRAVRDLGELFDAFGGEPSWSERQDAMVNQCRDLLAYSESAGMAASAQDWRVRLSQTEQWPDF